MIMDDTNQTYLVLTLDAPGNNNQGSYNGKTLSASFSSTGIVGLETQPTTVVKDDGSEVGIGSRRPARSRQTGDGQTAARMVSCWGRSLQMVTA